MVRTSNDEQTLAFNYTACKMIPYIWIFQFVSYIVFPADRENYAAYSGLECIRLKLSREPEKSRNCFALGEIKDGFHW